MEDEKPEEVVLKPELRYEKQIFTFIIDRSGSMGGSSRMQLAKDALILFLKSLPQGSFFQVVSFGSKFDFLQVNGKSRKIEYNEDNMTRAIQLISIHPSLSPSISRIGLY